MKWIYDMLSQLTYDEPSGTLEVILHKSASLNNQIFVQRLLNNRIHTKNNLVSLFFAQLDVEKRKL
jgi:hypothetical protein